MENIVGKKFNNRKSGVGYTRNKEVNMERKNNKKFYTR